MLSTSSHVVWSLALFLPPRNYSTGCASYVFVAPKIVLIIRMGATKVEKLFPSIIKAINKNKLSVHKDLGVVTEVFKTVESLDLKGNVGIGHVRYPTAGCSDVSEAQPFHTINPVEICLAHNGTLTNSDEMREFLLNKKFCKFPALEY